MEPFSQANV